MTRTEILAANPLQKFLEDEGVVIHGHRSKQCPRKTHEDEDVAVDLTKNVWNCHACGTGGTFIDWIIQRDGVTAADVLKKYGSNGSNGTHKATAPSKRTDPPAAPPTPPADLTATWRAAVTAFTDDHSAKLAEWRGLPAEFVAWLRQRELIGLHQGNVALPVHGDEDRVTAIHYRKKDGGWRYEPTGTTTKPLVFGDPKTAENFALFESQWDQFALAAALGWHRSTEGLAGWCFISTRGAGNAKLAKPLVRVGANVFAFGQNDTAGQKWLHEVADELHRPIKSAVTPAPHKDCNEWLKAGAGVVEFGAAMQDAKVIEPTRELKPPATAELPATKAALPPWTDAAEFCASEIEAPPEIIKGILHQICKLVIGGSSKARKSWLLLHLALAVSAGMKWLNFETTKARVLFVNFELPTFAIYSRLKAIARHLSLDVLPDTLTLWNLRGYAAPYDVLLPRITEAAKAGHFGLIILDPSYKLLGDADENSASDIARLLNALERLAVDTGAAIAFSAHFAKGNASGKEAQDRISGSGVFARDPDAIMVCTALETADSYAVESILRTLPPQTPFAIRWQYPAFTLADDLDPADLKKAARTERPTPTAEQVLGLFTTNTATPRTAMLSAVELRALFDAHSWNRTAAPAVRDRLVSQGQLKVHHGAHNVKLTGLPAMVDAYAKQLAEADTILDQPALKVRTPKRRYQRK